MTYTEPMTCNGVNDTSIVSALRSGSSSCVGRALMWRMDRLLWTVLIAAAAANTMLLKRRADFAKRSFLPSHLRPQISS